MDWSVFTGAESGREKKKYEIVNFPVPKFDLSEDLQGSKLLKWPGKNQTKWLVPCIAPFFPSRGLDRLPDAIPTLVAYGELSETRVVCR